jgi:hypothetical protein
MGTAVIFKLAAVQKKVSGLLKSGAKHILLPRINNAIGSGYYTCPAHENMATLCNGPGIWIGGLEDRGQAEKIPGHERNAIYVNGISERPYAAVTTACSGCCRRFGITARTRRGDYRGWRSLRGRHTVHGFLRCPAGGHRIMKILKFFRRFFWRERAGIKTNIKEKSEGMDNVEVFDSFGIFGDTIRPDDSCLLNVWANTAAGILTRNAARVEFSPMRIRPIRGYSKTMPFLTAF